MLAIQYPWRYASVFEELCDFHVINPTQKEWTAYPNCVGDKDLWLDCSSDYVPKDLKDFQGLILPCFEEPGRNLLSIPKLRVPDKLNIGIWQGDRDHLKLMHQAADVVAIPYDRYGRTFFISQETASLYHAYEFCNLDELRRFPWGSLHTSIPCQAALLGIDLRSRERRPKRLPPFSYDMYLTELQLELAYENAKAIKESMIYANSNQGVSSPS